MEIEWIESGDDYLLYEAAPIRQMIYMSIERVSFDSNSNTLEVNAFVKFRGSLERLFRAKIEGVEEAKSKAESLLKKMLPEWIEARETWLKEGLNQLNEIRSSME